MADIAPRAPDRTAEADDTPPAASRALKAAVIAMGVLLVVGFAVVIITIADRAANPEASAGPAGFGTVDVAVPPGAKVVGSVLEGRRALVTLRDEAGRETLVILDVIRGEEVGRFALGAE